MRSIYAQLLCIVLSLICEVAPFTPPSLYAPKPHIVSTPTSLALSKKSVCNESSASTRQNIVKNTAIAILAFVLTWEPTQVLASSNVAGRISLNEIPPKNIQVNVKDLPVVGNIVSGTYGKVVDNKGENPSVTISSPKDKFGAIRAVTTEGHIELDIDGLFQSHLDVDISANEAGVATIKVMSPLIPKLPFKNSASSGSGTVEVFSGKESDWYKLVNAGTGETTYWNKKTGESQYEKPLSSKSDWYQVINTGTGDVTYWNKKSNIAQYEKPNNI